MTTGMVVTVAGDPTGKGPTIPDPILGFPTTFQDGVGTTPPTAAEFNGVGGIAIVGSSLYITDLLNDAVRKMDLTTYKVTTLTGSPLVNTEVQGSLAKAGLNTPRSLVFDPKSGLYVGDNNTIVRIH
jgi:hypothetical protein